MTKGNKQDIESDMRGLFPEPEAEKKPHYFVLNSERRMYCVNCRALMNDPAHPFCAA